jgi:hypothetical protein
MAQKFYDAANSPNKAKQDMHQYSGSVGKEMEQASATGEADPRAQNDDYWLLIARDAYVESESYYDANIRKNHERNLAHFGSRHAPGSKYYKEAYKFRHKSFRPKTRSFVRRQEASLLKSMFSTSDFVTVKAARSHHPSHRISANINQKLLQYRLENTIPWFQTVLGAYQETLNLGMVCSHQYWDYEEEGTEKDFFEQESDTGIDADMEPGQPKDMQQTLIAGDQTGNADATAAKQVTPRENSNVIDVQFQEKGEIVKDTPAVELRPIENLFFSVAADWRDPAGTSPFIIDKIPMFLDEVMIMGQKGEWFALSEAQLLTGVTTDYNSVRRQREDNREDSKDQRHLHRGFDTVWVHRNIIKKGGVDWIYYTLGIHYRLSEPVPLRQDKNYKWLRPGERPYVIGFSNIEAHKNYPESLVGIASGTQQDANLLNNTRFDNVELSLNRRYIVKRGSMIDYRGLQRNVPGGVTEADDPQNDIKMEAPPDVTSSAYEEQNRINGDFDELVGMFSGSSVSNNRSMNETVGGMKMLQGDADSLTEYPMMVFMVTWVIPVLKQIIRLEQHFESDPALLNLMGEELQLWQKHSVDRVTDKWIQGSMNLQVAANFGASNPEQRIQRIAYGFGIIFQMAPQLAQRLDGKELAKEIMGALGYQGTERFFPSEKPEVPGTQPTEDKGQLTEQDSAKLDQDFKKDSAKLEQDERRLEFEIQRHADEMANREKERQLKGEITAAQLEESLRRIEVDRQNKVDEMKIKLRMGTGI